MENERDFQHDDLLRRAVDAVRRAPTPDTLPPERIDQLVETVEQAADQPYPFTMIERARTMKSRFAIKIVVTTTIVVACFGLISWLAPNGTTSLAFADVAEALSRVQFATWKTKTVEKNSMEGMPKEMTTTTDNMFLAPSHERMESTRNGHKSIKIVDGQKGKILTLMPKTKMVIATSFKGLPEGVLGDTFTGFRNMVISAKEGKSKRVKQLGTETIDGRPAELFCFQSKNPVMKYQGETKIWADPKTSLPIRVERSYKSEQTESHSVMTDFQIEMDDAKLKLDPSLFSVEVPEGYNVPQTAQLDFTKGPLPMVAEVLGIAAEMNDGIFPDTLGGGPNGFFEIRKRMPEYLQKKYSKDPKELFALSMRMPAGIAALAAMTQRKSGWHYAGKGVKLNTPDRPILWFELQRNFQGQKLKGKYDVLYADLSVKRVSKEDLPKMPEAEGSSEAEKPKDAKK